MRYCCEIIQFFNSSKQQKAVCRDDARFFLFRFSENNCSFLFSSVEKHCILHSIYAVITDKNKSLEECFCAFIGRV